MMRRQVDKRQIITGAPPEFARSVLDNGVRVVTETISSVRSVSVGVWVFAGSRDEPKSLNGISHLIEHMVFKGTRRRRTHHIAHRMESVGGYLNAFTGKEYTCFYARSLDEHLNRAIDTVCDLVLFPSFPGRELDKEKEVVLEEMKMYEDAPEDLVFDHFESAAYRGHSLARPVIGTPRTLRSVDREDLLRFVDRHYTPNRIVISVAGNARHGDVLKFVQRSFEGASRQRRSVRRRKVPHYTVSEVVVDRPISQAHVVLGLRALGASDVGRVALAVLNTILGGGMSSRLNQNIREKYGYCYQIYSFLNMHSDAGDFGVYMGTDPDRVERSRKLILRELDRLRQNPVSSRALSSAKSQVKGSIMLGLEGMSNRMMRLGRQELYYQKYYSLDQVIDEIETVTADDVQSIAQKLLDPEKLSSVIVRPSSQSQTHSAT